MIYTSTRISANLMVRADESRHLSRPLKQAERTKPAFSSVAKKGEVSRIKFDSEGGQAIYSGQSQKNKGGILGLKHLAFSLNYLGY